jgi:hypothetical protein
MPQNGDLVCVLNRVSEFVSDEDDGIAGLCKSLELGEKLRYVTRCENGGWLVQDQYARVMGERSNYFELLTLGITELIHASRRIDDEARSKADLFQ